MRLVLLRQERCEFEVAGAMRPGEAEWSALRGWEARQSVLESGEHRSCSHAP